MNLKTLLSVVAFLTTSVPLEAHSQPNPISNITVIGSVFCDVCSTNTFFNHGYFLQGVKVLLKCNFKARSPSTKHISIMATKTTDQFGIYHLDIPQVDGFECQHGQKIKTVCQASIIGRPSSLCNIPGLQNSKAHVTVKPKKANMCVINLNAMNYRPPKRDLPLCDTQKRSKSSSFDSSLFFWPLFPPFGLPWPSWLPLPFNLPPLPFPNPSSLPFPFNLIPFPDPSSLPFSIPSWLLPFLNPPFLPFPLFSPTTPSSPPPFPVSADQPRL